MDNDIVTINLSPIELAHHLQSLRVLSKDDKQFQEAIQKYITESDKSRIGRIIDSFEIEDEFALICKLIGTCKSISKLDQTPIIENNNEIIPDFLCSFEPNGKEAGVSETKYNVRFNTFIEVKSCEKKVFKISKNDLNKRKNYANRFKLPLFFAICFLHFRASGMWIVIDSEDLSKKRRVDPTDYVKHYNHIFFDDYFIYPLPNLHLAYYYSKRKVSGIKHKEYGTLTQISFLDPDGPFNIPKEIVSLSAVIFDAFSAEIVQKHENDDYIVIIKKFSQQARSLSAILYFVNNQVTDEEGSNLFNATRLIAELSNKNTHSFLIDRELVNNVMDFINSKKSYFYKLAFENPKDHQKKLARLMS